VKLLLFFFQAMTILSDGTESRWGWWWAASPSRNKASDRSTRLDSPASLQPPKPQPRLRLVAGARNNIYPSIQFINDNSKVLVGNEQNIIGLDDS
jgi:hypothetical protein